MERHFNRIKLFLKVMFLRPVETNNSQVNYCKSYILIIYRQITHIQATFYFVYEKNLNINNKTSYYNLITINEL